MSGPVGLGKSDQNFRKRHDQNLRNPHQEFQRAKASLGISQAEEYFRPRESELVAILNREQAQLNELMMKLQTLERSLKVVP